MARPAAAQLHHLALEVRDVARSEWFYDRFLGRIGFRRFVREATYLAYTNGELTLWFLRPRSPRVRRSPPDPEDEVIPDHLAFRVSDADEVRKVESDLGRGGIFPLFRAAEHPEFRPGYFSATWVDPDQMALEVYSVPTRRPRARQRRTRPAARSARRRPRPAARTARRR